MAKVVDESWIHKYSKNGYSIPSTTIHHTDSFSKTKKRTAPVSRLFQIVFDSVNGIPVPSIVIQKASRLNGNISCRLSMSLFDLESAAFIGRTWHSPYAIPVIKPITDEDSDGSEGNSEVPKVDRLRAHLIGNKLNVKLRNQCVYFQTQLQSKHIVAVFEVAFEVATNDTTANEVLAGGWTLIYLFNPKRGGIDLQADSMIAVDDPLTNLKVTTLYTGSPRILPFVAPLLLDATSGFPGIQSFTAASLQYYLIARSDIKKKSLIWKENTFVSPSDKVPGIEKISVRGIRLAQSRQVYLSQLKIHVDPTLDQFEEKMLESIRDSHYEGHPQTISMDREGNLSAARILERRLHIGFHNTFDFIQPPTIVTLQYSIDEETLKQELNFLGDVKLEDLEGDDISLVFAVEYKVLIAVRELIEPKGNFTKLVERLSTGLKLPSDGKHSVGLEKLVIAGWNYFDHKQVKGSNESRRIPLNLRSGPNPFSALIYRAHSDLYPKEDNDLSENYGSKGLPLQLNFHIFDDLTVEEVEVEAVAVKTIDTIEKEAIIIEVPQVVEDVAEVVDIPEKTPPAKHEFTPTPIIPPHNVISNLSRVEKARILNAGFEMFLDSKGNSSVAVDAMTQNGIPKYLIATEADDQRANRLTFQFMAITLNDDFQARSGGFNFLILGLLPVSVTFAFQFYTFPTTSTERLAVYTGPLPTIPYKDTPKWPGILFKTDRRGQPLFNQAPGVAIHFDVEGSSGKNINMRYGRSAFPCYMSHKQLYIDVWDGESKLHLGTACVDLKYALRQGRGAIQIDQDVDIVLNQYADEDCRLSAGTSRGQSNDHLVRSLTIGSLHLRIINTAKEVLKGELAAGQGSGRIIVADYREEIKFRPESVGAPKRLCDVDMELRKLLVSNKQEKIDSRSKTASNRRDILTEDGRKLQKLYQAMKRDKVEIPANWDVSQYVEGDIDQQYFTQSRGDKEKELKLVAIFRERHRKRYIEEALKRHLTTKYVIEASFAQGHYFEYVLQNPYDFDQTFELSWNDKDLRIVTREDEWLHNRRLNNITEGIEANLLSQLQYERAEIFLGPNEKVSIPFLFQSFTLINFNSMELADSERNPARCITISILNAKKKPIVFLEILISPLNFYIDRSVQLFHCENELVRKIIRYATQCQRNSNPAGILNMNSDNSGEKYLKCSNSDVVCSILPSSRDSKYRDISFKYRIGSDQIECRGFGFEVHVALGTSL